MWQRRAGLRARVKELIVVAQDITAFGADRGKVEVARLLDELNKVEGIAWIRLLYAYPERITDEFVAAMVRNDKVLHYLDVPIQHIDSDVLRAMNRKGDEGTVRAALEKLRAAMPGYHPAHHAHHRVPRRDARTV